MTPGEELGRFREQLAGQLGWAFSDRDAEQLGPLLDERARAHRLSRDDYLHRLAARPWPDELTALIERLSITETYFFRHGEQFRALREEALPERIAARSGQRVLKMLSVACSSGEEAYSLAITAREAVGPDWLVRVVGVDANPAVLAQATAGRYSAWSLRETSDAVRRRWFHQESGGYRIAEDVVRLTRFRRSNVAEPDPELWRPDQYDVIFCRNLLMYLTPALASSLVSRMTEALVPGGYLFLGHTDSLGTTPPGLELRQSHHAFYYRRPPAGCPPAQRPAPRPEPAPAVRETRDDLYHRALVLLGEERFADALDLVTRVPGPRTGRDRLLHGVLLAQAGRLEEATDAARRLIDDDGLNADAHQLLGLCLEGVSATEEAITQYRLAAFLDHGFAQPRLRLGQLARRRGDGRAAAGELDQALRLLAGEDDTRILLFGGGFGRIALTVLCRAELDACGVRP
ncbi:CheR family methyltransferase [Actinoplanes sp. CA-030573]|uniref:CheR family methyltransferase n=1 Tax=Actinoplanes sp. CA-030573 TaxID=3239898 RepID=UPI003D949A19